MAELIFFPRSRSWRAEERLDAIRCSRGLHTCHLFYLAETERRWARMRRFAPGLVELAQDVRYLLARFRRWRKGTFRGHRGQSMIPWRSG